MTEGTSSCRPARLLRFEETLDAVADGLARRRGALADALEAYRASCSTDYRVPTAGTAGVVKGFGRGLRDFGHWVGDVGRAFEDAAVAEAFMGTGGTDMEGVIRTDDDILLGYLSDHLDPGEDPYRGVPEGMATTWADRLGIHYDQNEPPAWVGYLEQGGNAADIISSVLRGAADALKQLPEWVGVSVRVEGGIIYIGGSRAVAAAFSAELQASVRLPTASAPRLASASRWVTRAGYVLAGGSGFASQWNSDAGMSTLPRVARATARGGATVLGGVAGGIAAGAVCGPGAPACSTVLGIAFGLGGAELGNELLDALPGMEPHEPAPGEHDLGELRSAIAANEGDVDPALAAAIDLSTSDLALEATAEDPAFQARVASLLPDRERLEFVIATGERPEEVTPTRTTTTTTLPAPVPAPVDPETTPDPWVEERPYE